MHLEEICLVPSVEYKPNTFIDFNISSSKEGYTSVKGFHAERLGIDKDRTPPVLTVEGRGVHSMHVDKRMLGQEI